MESRHGDTPITEEGLARLRGRVGRRYPLERWNTVASADAIRHFAHGYGDDNPLFTDPAYAAGTRWGSVIAPPFFLDTFNSFRFNPALGGLPGVFGLWAEDEWQFHRPVLAGEAIDGYAHLLGIEPRASAWGGVVYDQVVEFVFEAGPDDIVATARRTVVRAERRRAREQGTYSAFTLHRYTEEELAQIDADHDAEQRRGADPRSWDSVRVGDSLGHVVKGPLTSVDMVTFLMGWGSPLCMANEIANRYLRDHPGAGIVDPETNVREFPEAAHWDMDLARRSGMFAPYDIGGQRIAWCGHLATNWAGDDGFVRRLKVRLRRPNFEADTTWVRGTVTGLREDGGRALVDCAITAQNQRGETTAAAEATIELPRGER